MADDSGNGVYLTMFFGKDRYTSPKLTVNGPDVPSVLKHLNDLSETSVDETGEEGASALDDLLEHIISIDAAATLKFGIQAPNAPQVTNTPATAPTAAVVPTGPVPNCDTHNTPMTWIADDTVKSGQNVGRHYSAWKCTQPFQRGVKCGMKNFTWK